MYGDPIVSYLPTVKRKKKRMTVLYLVLKPYPTYYPAHHARFLGYPYMQKNHFFVNPHVAAPEDKYADMWKQTKVKREDTIHHINKRKRQARMKALTKLFTFGRVK